MGKTVIKFSQLVQDVSLTNNQPHFDESAGFIALNSPEGKNLFHSFVANNFTEDKESYAYSLGYYLITGRKGAWIYGDENFIFIACYHPNIDNEFLFFAPLYNQEKVFSVSRLIGLDTIKIARVSTEQQTTSDAIRQDEESVMDWIFPSHTLSTKNVNSFEGPEFRRARRAFRDFQDSSVEIISSYTSTESLLPLLKKQAKFLSKNQTLSEQEILNSLIEGIRVYDQNKDQINIALFYMDKNPMGIVLWDKTLDNHSNLLWLIHDIDQKNIGYWLYWNLCTFLNDQGIDYLNVGGSETAGLNEFKSNFAPVQSFSCSNLLIDVAQENKIAA